MSQHLSETSSASSQPGTSKETKRRLDQFDEVVAKKPRPHSFAGISLSIGVETADGIMCTFVKRNAILPTKESKLFSTKYNNQNKVSIKIYKGESMMTEHNILLGQLELSGIPDAPCGVPEIKITVEMDEHQILKARAVEKISKNEKMITLTSSLSESEISQHIEMAEHNKSTDVKLLNIALARNKLKP